MWSKTGGGEKETTTIDLDRLSYAAMSQIPRYLGPGLRRWPSPNQSSLPNANGTHSVHVRHRLGQNQPPTPRPYTHIDLRRPPRPPAVRSIRQRDVEAA
ncbi:hypothetical protein GWI33_016907 [Rhynchophorus ferrugineus]|uniref:Uncharacterized protein n=1 Tax=Rhynchophorus ferrugineus TaxID=354439 RepID=A0A834HWJ3_RHYFE|nr:hypothetical protein GWI33_016907 [Rhynchophorus ferrugineus]